MPLLTGGQALVQQLKKEGVEVIFALPGVQLDWMFDALYDAQDSIRVVHARNEQAVSYMADGYARATGKVGVCAVVPGPGLLNAMAGLSTAYACSSPVLCIAGQIDSGMIGKGKGMLHEIPNQLEAMASVTKWAGRAMKPGEVPGLVREAFRQLATGRPRPVEIEVPQDTLRDQAEMSLLDVPAPAAAGFDAAAVERAGQALGRAERPVIVAGGGALGAGVWDDIQRLAEALEAPVIMTQNGRGVVSEHHYLAQIPSAGPHLLPQADVVLAVGTRFLTQAAQIAQAGAKPTIIHLDIDGEEIGRNQATDIRIVGDSRAALPALVHEVARFNHVRPSRQEELQTLQEATHAELLADEHRAPLAMAVRAALPEEGVVVADMTQVGYWSRAAFPVYEPRTLIGPGYQGTLGFGYCTALGAKVGQPDRPVVCLAGDGGFMYTVGELSTAVRHGINVVAVVFNDSAFGNVRRIQTYRFNNRTIASDLVNPDFVQLAESFGMLGLRANNPAELQQHLTKALAANAPALIEVPVPAMPPFAALGGG